ncbi:hypothetical protein BU23DRAFT_234989 [Bimuria novae-zelandiae CBS 107.79]|uniref:Uncharacterized protein n=1 Tax=Bimuria novae-zelandiae CBS 107.79 TaxID=1447943 RepID=A0A6A5V0S3_9PLEO|nr:hypothetical protein BU23DRAFT_234989 [Bimuria novae-zelandiae CBS 107.79]
MTAKPSNLFLIISCMPLSVSNHTMELTSSSISILTWAFAHARTRDLSSVRPIIINSMLPLWHTQSPRTHARIHAAPFYNEIPQTDSRQYLFAFCG